MSVKLVVAFLLALAVTEGLGPGDTGQTLRCRCIQKEKRPMGRLIKSLQVIFPNSHCRDKEIIATMKTGGPKVCLDPDAPWVKMVLEADIKKIEQRRVETKKTRSG